MHFYQPIYCGTETASLINLVELNASKLIQDGKRISAIIALRELSASPRIKAFIRTHNGASYTFYDSGEILSLYDGKAWMEAIENGKSVLDGVKA